MATIMSLSANAAVARPAAGRAAAQRRTATTVRASAAPDNKGVQQVAKGSSSSSKAVSMGRRDAVLFGSSALQLLVASKAWALIPGNDDEDEELLAKAKESRAAKIQAERALEKNYVTKNNLKLDADTSKVQIAVFKLSKAGGLIDQDGPWVEAYVKAASALESFAKDSKTADNLKLL